MNPTGYLGGNVSMRERHRPRDKYLAGREPVDLGCRRQCRCGGTRYTIKWKRWYCVQCARWVRGGVGYFPFIHGQQSVPERWKST